MPPSTRTRRNLPRGKWSGSRHVQIAIWPRVIGVSSDSVKSHENFRSKMEFPFDLLSDPDEKLCAMFGVMKMKNMYGRQVRGIERSTFAIGRDGVVVREWRGVRVPGHAQEVLEFARSL